jgi:hypothetical protein
MQDAHRFRREASGPVPMSRLTSVLMTSPDSGIIRKRDAYPATIPARDLVMREKAEARAVRRPRMTSLRREQAVYEAHLRRWLGEHGGEHVLVMGDEVVGFFATRDEALAAGYARFGVVPLFVKQVTAAEPIHDLPNVIL